MDTKHEIMFMDDGLNDGVNMTEISLPFSLPSDAGLTELDSFSFINASGNEGLQPNNLFLDPNFQLDDTMDAQLKYNPEEEFIPTCPRGPPERENLPGIHNFEVEINSSSTNKKTYLYSHRLNRIYVNMGCKFSVNFNWDVSKVQESELYVRATVVFSDLAEAQKRVERCLQHAHESVNVGIANQPHLVKNILRSARGSGPDAPGVYYCGRSDIPDSWYSVLVRFTAPSAHAYQFECKNSCSSGINRRSIAIIFTLESSSGLVLGRQSVGARVCSCPRRDLLRDESDPSKKGKRPITTTEPPPVPVKRVGQDTGDHEPTFTLPATEVVGARAAIAGYRVMIDVMEATKAGNRLTQQGIEAIDSRVNNLKNIIDTINRDHKQT